MTRQLADAQEKLLCELKTFIYRFWEILLSKDSLFQNKYYFEFHFYGFLKRRIHALVGKLKKQMFLLVSGGHICAPERDTNMAPPHKAL